MSDPAAAFAACQASITPREPSDMIADHATAMGSMMKQLGLGTCVTGQAGVDFIIGGADASVSSGCEQVAIMSSAVDTTQRVLQCAVSAVSQTTSTFVMAHNNITINLTGHAVLTCFDVSQTIEAKIASYGEFGSDVQQEFGVEINSMVKSMAENVQTATKDITALQGQKVLTDFTNQLEQSANSSTYATIAQEAINDYQASNSFTLNLSDYAMVGSAYPSATAACALVIDQTIMMQVLVQNIMDNSLTNVFSTTEGATFVAEWRNSQISAGKVTRTDLGAILAGLIGLVLVGCLALGLFMILKNGGNNSVMTGQGGSPGSRGKIIAVFLILLGIVFFILGIVSLATGFSTIAGAIGLVAGLVMISLGGYLFWRATQVAKPSG